MICVGLIYAAFCIWYAKVPSDMIITNSNDMIKNVYTDRCPYCKNLEYRYLSDNKPKE